MNMYEETQKFEEKLRAQGYTGVVCAEGECGCDLKEFPACTDGFDTDLCNGGYVRYCHECKIKDTEGGCELYDNGCDSCIHKEKLISSN